ncbi:ADP-heptose:LPS heptosyltransferase [Prosthecobacter fusiformis]|uniref:ADP-heptose:LPS heptosyltransferase n=1 Tax=Prosthecobacter fusiformis TaxID=48464 RepID=A0A4R7RWI6_9BACT|nr:glycosyltransferase family 9 protein [Prosthecobacter fusiformis]TDU69225.1 ADP-heptose:LPS heptosyltransferase [Prosthecobacter fusiformis]
MNAGAAIVSDKQLGDVLLLQPSAQHLAGVTGKDTALFVRDAFQPLVELMPGCTWGPGIKGSFSQVWTTNWSSRAVWQAFRLRCKRRILIVNKTRHLRWWYRFVFHDVRMEPANAEYWARYTWRVISGQKAEDFIAPRLETPPAEWGHEKCPAGDFILINPTAAWSRKFWGADQWAETMRRLPLNGNSTFVIAGGGSEREKAHCEDIVKHYGMPVLDLCGRTSMKQYLHLLSKARMVLCIDGAASHLAQAFGVPTMTVFGPTHHRKWHWPAPQHRVLAACDFNLTAAGVPNGQLSATEVPVDAFLKEAELVLKTL